MEKIVALCKGRGFIFPGSEIYGGLANTWDYGPLGVELKTNIKNAWRKKFIQENPYNVGLDSAILMNPQTWVASGHLGGFSDPLMDCRECKTRHRADNLIEDFDGTNVAGWTNQQMTDYINEKEISGIHLEPNAKRFYPYGTLAAQVIGFTNASNEGAEGVEAAYNSFLSGASGRVITTKGNNEMELYDLDTDSLETVNLATQHPEVVKQLWDYVREAHQPVPNDVEKFKLDINFPE